MGRPDHTAPCPPCQSWLKAKLGWAVYPHGLLGRRAGLYTPGLGAASGRWEIGGRTEALASLPEKHLGSRSLMFLSDGTPPPPHLHCIPHLHCFFLLVGTASFCGKSWSGRLCSLQGQPSMVATFIEYVPIEEGLRGHSVR